MELALRASRLSRREKTERIAFFLDKVGLADRSSSKPAQLSGGQQQRLAVARALVPSTGILLLDEPFAWLDIPLREQIAELILERHFADRLTTVAVLHDPCDALLLQADKLLLIDAGRIAAEMAFGKDSLASSDQPLLQSWYRRMHQSRNEGEAG